MLCFYKAETEHYPQMRYKAETEHYSLMLGFKVVFGVKYSVVILHNHIYEIIRLEQRRYRSRHLIPTFIRTLCMFDYFQVLTPNY